MDLFTDDDDNGIHDTDSDDVQRRSKEFGYTGHICNTSVINLGQNVDDNDNLVTTVPMHGVTD